MLAKAFLDLVKKGAVARASRKIVFSLARDYAPNPDDTDYIKKSDVPWVDRFAANGGHAIISGDVNMRTRPHEKLALYSHGLVVIFFDPKWSEWDYFKKSALMLFWWEQIADKVRAADRGTFWAVPCAWPSEGGELRNVSFGLARILKDSPHRDASPEKPMKQRTLRTSRLIDQRQPVLPGVVGESRRRPESTKLESLI